MSEEPFIQDIARVQRRIARLRQRMSGHVHEATNLPVLNTWKNYGELGRGLFTSAKNTGSTNRFGWLSIVAAIAGWYFSQPDAWKNMRQKLESAWTAWRNRTAEDQPASPPSGEQSAESSETTGD